MAKSQFLQIRMAPPDLERVKRAAEADHLDTSTWARRLILHAIESRDFEASDGHVAEHSRTDG